MYKYDEIVIGIDESYTRTGITIVVHEHGKQPYVKDVKSVDLSRYKTKSEKRKMLREHLKKVMFKCSFKSEHLVVMCERARLHGGGNSFINIDAIGAMCVLTALIVDIAALFNAKVFSIDTRAWRTAVIGNCKKVENNIGVPPEKYLTVQYVLSLGLRDKVMHKVNGRKTKGTFVSNGVRYYYDNDACDSVGIAMSYFVASSDKLQLEK